jgi:IclR family KDG regulon transcriptional repressor
VTTGPRQSGDGTVAKALTVLDAVAEYGRPVRFTELLEDSPYPKATLYRFVQTLTAQGMLSFDPERQTYAPGLRLVRLAHAAWQASSLAPIARPYLDDLSREHGGNGAPRAARWRPGALCRQAQRSRTGGDVFAGRQGRAGLLHRRRQGDARLPAGEPILPLSCSGRPGMLHAQDDHRRGHAHAELAAIRARGHAFDDEEHEPGIICVAVPIRTRAGRVLGAVSVTSTTAHRSCGLDGHLSAIGRAVSAIAGEAQDWRFPDQAAE